MRSRNLLLGVLVVCAALAGCGGGGDSAASTAQTSADKLVALAKATPSAYRAEPSAAFTDEEALSYIASYPDLIVALGADPDAGRRHYAEHGKAEGRGILFRPFHYLASYPDLIETLGSNGTAAARHYIEQGWAAGRLITFEAYRYLASWPDLLRAFGDNDELAARHYVQHGYREGRTVTFQAQDYLANYPDLSAAFGTDRLTGTLHYLRYGFAEGRTDKMPTVLVLYDQPTGTEYDKLGEGYSIMLRNLLGHFPVSVRMQPVRQYTAGSMDAHVATFYLGATWQHPLPTAFLADAAATQRPLVWFKYNLWQLADDPAWNFAARRGFRFTGLRGLNAPPSSADPAPGFFDTVQYKGLPFVKYYQYDASANVVHADPDIGVTSIVDANLARVVVPVSNPKTGEVAPYVVRSGKVRSVISGTSPMCR
jgi:hypothetical protein